MKRNNEFAIIFKKKIDKDGNIEFTPLKVALGVYNKEDKIFIDKDGTPYYHILENPNNFGYGYRNYIDAYKNTYPLLSNLIISKIVFSMVKKYRYTYNTDNETNAPVILFSKINKNSDSEILNDEDMTQIYKERFPLFVKLYLNNDDNTNTQSELVNGDINVEKLYSELTSRIIDQEEPIRKILTPIWKHCSNFSDDKSNNMLINGAAAVGKTEICRYLTKSLNIPCFMTTIDYVSLNYHGKFVEGMLIELLRAANYDIDRASRGILIIDKLEKINEVNHQNNITNELLKLLEGCTFTLTLNIGEYTFDTRKLMVICLSNLRNLNIDDTKHLGFNTNNDKLNCHKSELFNKFSTVIQMNNLNYDSFIKILKSKEGTLNLNKRFLSSKGVSLKIKQGTMKEIAERVTKEKYGVRSLDEIVETALSVASFEIATNPELYSELIITPDTIKDNKKYTLIKRM